MKCGLCETNMKKGLVIMKAFFSIPRSELYWCKDRGFLEVKDKQELLGPGVDAEAYLCEKCKLVSFRFQSPDQNNAEDEK